MIARKNIVTIHALAGTGAFIMISAFQMATLTGEIIGDGSLIASIKTGIALSLLVLAPLMAIAGVTGRRLSGGATKGLPVAKLRRLQIAAINGLLVLVPSALFLLWKARTGSLDMSFRAVQTLELGAGLANVTLLGLNMIDGFKLSGRLRHRPATKANRSKLERQADVT